MQRLGESHLRLVGSADDGEKKQRPKREREPARKKRKTGRFADPLEAESARMEAVVRQAEDEAALTAEKRRIMETNRDMIDRANDLTRWSPGG